MPIFKKSKFKICLILFSIFYFLFSIAPLGAQTMSNPSFKLKTNILLTPNKDSNNNKEATNKTQVNISVGPNYKVISGFLDDPSSLKEPFIFSISQTFIDYGILSPTNPVDRTNILSVYNAFPSGYSVTLFENHSLINETSLSTIPDTTCDTGTCSDVNPAPWTNILTYGFGYRCDNMSDVNVCSNDFYDSNYYKHFPNISNSQISQILMSSTNIGENKARIIYRVNVSRTQTIGFYNNAITFVAAADF